MSAIPSLQANVSTLAYRIAVVIGHSQAVQQIDVFGDSLVDPEQIAVRFRSGDTLSCIFLLARSSVWLELDVDRFPPRFAGVALPAFGQVVQFSMASAAGHISREEPPIAMPNIPLGWDIALRG